MNDASADDFAMHIAFEGHRATVAVVGEVDMVTAPSLAVVLNGLIADGYRQLVVDFGGLTFMDARGLNVLAESARRATSAGGTFTVRSLPTLTHRILAVTNVGDLVAFETSPADASTLGPEQQADDLLAGIGDLEASGRAGSPNTLVRSSTEVIDAALGLVTALAEATIDNADGVSVTLERYGRLVTVAASDDSVLTMDRHQYETGEGPCLEAKAQGRWFYIESLADETRWPAFVPLALGQGIRSILSSPLMTQDRPQGALNIYSSTKQAFGTHEQELAALFAEQASNILTTAGPEVTDEEANQRFAIALAARQTIHRAQGVIMARYDLTADQAGSSLMREARTAGITVLARAIEVVGSLHLDDGHA